MQRPSSLLRADSQRELGQWRRRIWSHHGRWQLIVGCWSRTRQGGKAGKWIRSRGRSPDHTSDTSDSSCGTTESNSKCPNGFQGRTGESCAIYQNCQCCATPSVYSWRESISPRSTSDFDLCSYYADKHNCFIGCHAPSWIIDHCGWLHNGYQAT